jgi:hypothetical protein
LSRHSKLKEIYHQDMHLIVTTWEQVISKSVEIVDLTNIGTDIATNKSSHAIILTAKKCHPIQS